METIIAAVSIIIAVASALLSVFTYYQNVMHDRKQETLEAYNRLQAKVFDMINTYTWQKSVIFAKIQNSTNTSC